MTAGNKFRQAIKDNNPLMIVGAINAYSAILAEKQNHKAIYLSGGGVAAASHGIPDLGITTMEDVLVEAKRITAASSLPLLVDIDTGWGGAFNIARTIKEMTKAGVAAVHMEDQVSQKRCGHRPNKSLVTCEEMVDRIKAAVDAKEDDSFFIMARTDAFASEGMQAAIDRSSKYLEAGADGIFLEAVTDLEDYKKFNSQVDALLLANITEFGKTPLFTNEELAGIAKISITTGKETEKITGEVLAQARISATRLGVVVNERDVVKEISKVSAATTLSLGKSGEAIADAVTTAKALGMELSKVEAISGSILQFESSIEDELSAELLIGKELNLDKARQAALNNDLATVAEEIAKQAGTAAEFGKMNRIQQEALAKAVGMNREELAQTLYVQEQLAGVSGDEAKRREKILNARIAEVGLAQAQQEMAEEGFETLEHQASVTQQLTAFTEKLNEVFVAIAPAVLAIADALMLVLTPIARIVGFVTQLGKMFGGIPATIGLMIPLLMKASFIAKGFALNGFKGAAAAIYRTFAAIPYGLGLPLAIAGVAGLGAVVNGASKMFTADDLMSSPTGGSGYGDRILVSKEGTYALNNRDTIIAGTDLFNKSSNQQQSSPVVKLSIVLRLNAV